MPFLAPVIGGIFAAGTTIGSLLGGVVGKVLISVGLQFAARALQKRDEAVVNVGGVSFDVAYGADDPRYVAMGLVARPGTANYDNSYDQANKRWQRTHRLFDFPVDGLSRVAINGEWVQLAAEETGDLGRAVITGDAAGFVWIKFYDGRQTVADPGLVNNSNPVGRWESTAVGTGICYAVVTSLYDPQNFTSEPQLLFEIRGSRLYDWRKDDTAGGVGAHRLNDQSTWEFTENPVVMEYNYRVGLVVNGDLFCGMDMPTSDLPLEKWTTAANICDEDVSGEPRFRASLIIDCDATEHGDVVDALKRATGGMVVDGVDGSWPIIGTDQPIVATLTDDDIVKGTRPVFRGRQSMSDLVNSVSGTFPDPDNLWSPTPYETQTDAALVASDRRTRDVRMDFPTVPYQRQATQLAATYLSENRFEATIENLIVRARWRVLETGDWINFNSQRWGNRTYLVVDRKIMPLVENGPRTVALVLQERSGTIYDSVGVVAPTVTPPVNAAPQYLQEVQGLSVTAVTLSGDNGLAAAGIRVSWSAIADTTVTGVEIQYRPKASPSQVYVKQLFDGVTVTFLSEGIVQQTEYEIRTLLLTQGRTATATAWQTVTTAALPAGSLNVQLGDLRDDTKDILKGLQAQVDELTETVQLTAAGAGASTAEQTVRSTQIGVQVEDARAAVVEEATARATADDALAQAITAVEASLGESLAQGLMKIQSNVDEGGASASITFFARITTEDDFKETGLVLEVYTEDEVIKSRTVLKSDAFIVTDGTDSNAPFAFVNGQLALALANIGTVTAGTVQSADAASLVIDLAAPLISLDDGL